MEGGVEEEGEVDPSAGIPDGTFVHGRRGGGGNLVRRGVGPHPWLLAAETFVH